MQQYRSSIGRTGNGSGFPLFKLFLIVVHLRPEWAIVGRIAAGLQLDILGSLIGIECYCLFGGEIYNSEHPRRFFWENVSARGRRTLGYEMDPIIIIVLAD